MSSCTDACIRPTPGTRIQHCTVDGCHQTFSSPSAGDRHRVGRFGITEGPQRRRCLTADEMLEAGLVLNARGMWRLAGTWYGNLQPATVDSGEAS